MYAINCPNLNLNQIYLSGQIFRWIKVGEGKFVIPYKDKAIVAFHNRSYLVLSCTEEEFYDFWFNYFNMELDYSMLNYKAGLESEYLKICSVRGSGIRIVRQELFETIISFIVSQQQSIPRIRAILDKMCILFGKMHKLSVRNSGRITWYEFPTPESILEKSEDLDKCSLGYRKDYILNICQSIVDGWLDFDLLRSMDYEDAKEYLMQFDGIGPKVADCICLYSLHHMQAFPIDSHIKEILEREFDTDDCEEATECYFPSLRNYRGLVQQYMFYNEINPPKEL